MKYTFETNGVCSKKIDIEIIGNVIKQIKFYGGCSGNLKGICNLVEGQNVNLTIKKLKGITCGLKPTSCPDQLAVALEYGVNKMKLKGSKI